MTKKLNDEIDRAFMLRERKRGLEAQIKETNSEITECMEWLIKRYDDIGTTTARGKLASATLTETLVPRIEDWGLVQEWIMENDAMYLVYRRVSSGPWKELLDSGQVVPGITPFAKRAISLRKLGD